MAAPSSTDPRVLTTPLFSGLGVPAHLPGEPDRDGPTGLVFLARLLLRGALTGLLILVTGPLWLPFAVARLLWGRAPTVPRAAQVLRYMRMIWFGVTPPPGSPWRWRPWLTLRVLRKVAVIPVWSLAWHLDTLLYGRRLRDTPVVAPLLEISAARSGSTQLARYIEADPDIVAPNMLQCMFPYLWLWRLAPPTLGRVISADNVRNLLHHVLPPEFIERHEGDPTLTDTYDAVLYMCHLNHLCGYLGPDALADDFGFALAAPHNRAQWHEDFVQLLEGTARKTLLQAGVRPDGTRPRFFLKGHFLCAADVLEHRFPDARFLTMVRAPKPRFQSAVNFLRANITAPVLGPTPWPWLAEGLLRSETQYCEIEQEWFSREGGATRCVLRFSEYVQDLEGAMSRVYAECLDTGELPAHVPREHTPRRRKEYLLNRSLEQTGIDSAALEVRLADYTAWCQPR